MTMLGLFSRDELLIFMHLLLENENYRIDSYVMSMLPIFHDKPSEDPYRHVDELSQVCEINQIHNVSAGVMKMKLFPATLRDRAKDWFLKLGKEFTSWSENGGGIS